MDIKEIEQKINDNEVQLLDVREKHEWDDGHLTLAKLVPLSLLEVGEEPSEEIDRDKKTYLHCRSGNRVLTAMPLLENLGFSNLVPLNEGFEQLVNLGFSHRSPLKTYLNQVKDFKFEFKSSTGHSAILDAPQNIGGGDEGLRPMELILGGLAGCSSFDVLSILKKSKQIVEDFKVEIKAHRREEIPQVFTHIHLTYLAKGAVEKNHLKRAVDLSLEKYCSVSKMLGATVKITSEYHIEN